MARLGPALAVLLVLGPAALLAPAAATSPPAAGEVFLVQGVSGSSWDFQIDGEAVGTADAKDILGPLDLEPGAHVVTATSDEDRVGATVQVGGGSSQDVVLHLPVDADSRPLMTTFDNDLSPVADEGTRLSISHTAAVGPADIKVDGEVLFADVASGEELSVVVPADTYRVAVVPAATDDPPVLGPVDLAVSAGTHTRVFAIGVAAQGTMDAVVHELPLPVRGSADAPEDVPGGTGGQHDPAPGPAPVALTGVLLLVGAIAIRGAGRARGSRGGE